MLDLTRKERDLLEALAAHPGDGISPARLIEQQSEIFGKRSVQGLHQTAASLVRKSLVWRVRTQYQGIAYQIRPEVIPELTSPGPPPTHRYAGTNPERQSVGKPGHCERCAQFGHVAAHPNLGCGDVGCTTAHGTDIPDAATHSFPGDPEYHPGAVAGGRRTPRRSEEGHVSASSLTLEFLEGGLWQVTINRDDGTVRLDMNNAEAELLWVMLGEGRGQGTFSRTVVFQAPS